MSHSPSRTAATNGLADARIRLAEPAVRAPSMAAPLAAAALTALSGLGTAWVVITGPAAAEAAAAAPVTVAIDGQSSGPRAR